MNNKIGKILGLTNTRFVYAINQIAPYVQSEYLIIEDSINGNLISEVIETNILPFAENSILPDGCTTSFIEKMEFDISKPIFLAKVKILSEIPIPIMPSSLVRPAVYKEIAHIISKADVDDSMILGIIKGTELSQEELPSKLQNISPLWEKGSSVSQKGVPLMLNHHVFREYPHLGLFGSSGSGKSFALRVVCEELMKLKIPALAFDPHYEIKFEGKMKNIESSVDNQYIIDYKDRYEEFIIGENVGIHFEDLTSTELIALFNFVDPLTEPQKNALELLFERGDSYTVFKNKVIAIKEAFEIKERATKGKKISIEEEVFTPLQTELYGKMKSQISGSVTLQALSWKCTALEKTGIFTCDITDVKKAMKKRKIAVIRGDIKRLQMISSYLINKLYKARRNYIDKGGDYFPPFFNILDEAHKFAPENGNIPTKVILRTIGQEARKYGVFQILSTQRPKILDNIVLSQLNTKFIFRLTDIKDMEVAKVEGNLTDGEVVRLPDLASGNCFVSSPILDKTYPVRFRTTFSKAPNVSDPFEEMDDKIKEADSEIETILLKYLPLSTFTLSRNLKKIIEEYDKTVSFKELVEILDKMANDGKIAKEKDAVGLKYIAK